MQCMISFIFGSENRSQKIKNAQKYPCGMLLADDCVGTHNKTFSWNVSFGTGHTISSAKVTAVSFMVYSLTNPSFCQPQAAWSYDASRPSLSSFFLGPFTPIFPLWPFNYSRVPIRRGVRNIRHGSPLASCIVSNRRLGCLGLYNRCKFIHTNLSLKVLQSDILIQL